jgi:hypothetical protein
VAVARIPLGGVGVVSREQIQINGAPTRIHGSFDREVQDDSGQPVGEMDVVAIIRGRLQNKQFMQLISRETVQLDYQDGQSPVTMVTRVVNHSAVASGEGEGSVYRHDITFRELPESYQRRAEERAAAAAAKPAEAPRPSPRVAVQEREPVGDISDVTTATDPSSWGDAIRQLRGSMPKPQAPEEPLTMPELAGIETVLVNLRLEALIHVLESTGLIPRGAAEIQFRELLEERFFEDASQIVGERVAQRALREMHTSH